MKQNLKLAEKTLQSYVLHYRAAPQQITKRGTKQSHLGTSFND